MNGLFVTLEGGEGTGKSTQIRRLRGRVEARGRQVVLTREPGGTPLGKRLRALLVETGDDPPGPRAELLLYAADRAHHVVSVICPALEAGRFVLCDRFADATEAYQGWGRGIDAETVSDVNRLATGGLRPHRTLVLDLDPEKGVQRALQRSREGTEPLEVRFEQENRAFHDRVRQGYRHIAGREPDRVRLVDADGTPDEVEERVWAGLVDLL